MADRSLWQVARNSVALYFRPARNPWFWLVVTVIAIVCGTVDFLLNH